MYKNELIMKKIYTILTAGAVLLLAASCDLNLTPKGSLVYDPESIITNESDVTGFEAGVIAQFRGIAGGGVMDEPQDIMMDYFNAVSDYGNNYGGVHRSDADLNPGNYDTRDNWRYPYLAMMQFNLVINGARTVPAEYAERCAIMRGEAFVARAYCYLHMIRLFAKPYGASASTDLGLPLVLEYDQTARPARSTVAEVYAQIKADLDSAAVLLAGVPGAVGAKKPTIDFVNAMYARYYLDTRNFGQAASYAAQVISSKAGYALASSLDEMKAVFVEDKGKEAILQFHASTQEGGYMSHTFYGGQGNDAEKGLYYRPSFIPTQTFLDAYDANDFRRQLWFTGADDTIYINGSYYKGTITAFRRFYGNPVLQTSDVPNTQQFIRPIGLSEMYLIAAEGYLGDGKTDLATKYLNDLQTARGAVTTAASNATVQKEWYRETPGLGLRISCLKRWGLGFNGRPGQTTALAEGVLVTTANFVDKSLPAGDYHYQWPVPTHEKQVNPNLVQNEGYTDVSVE